MAFIPPNEPLDQNSNLQQILNTKVRKFTKPHVEGGSTTFFLIRRYLRQFGLRGVIDEADIFNEAYLRIQKQVNSGQEFKNITAWFNRICFNVVREEYKKRNRTKELIDKISKDPSIIDKLSSQFSLSLSNENDIEILRKIIKRLNPKDQKIIELRWIEGLTWKEIGDIWVKEGENLENDIKLQNRLRKQGERLVNILREEFFSTLSGGNNDGK